MSDTDASLSLKAVTADLRDLARKSDRGFRASQDQLVQLRALTKQVEAYNTEEAPVDSSQLLGRWSLTFTDAADVLSLKILPAEVGEIAQTLEVARTPEAELVAFNSVELQPLGSAYLSAFGLRTASSYTIRGKCKKLSASRVSLVFDGGTLQPEFQLLKQGFEPKLPAIGGELPLPVVQALQGVIGDRVFLDTTFLDEDLRVARGPGQEIWVLSRTMS
eukprot:CAMPEP_0119324618 /NCGR_PEP_ID=MMETSP1333-20130426/63746_1 /TAXON_ID=418940 /ORGANISM="Scyphosphaera apsteinii, Strain RCC1455" /LENGTH=218 /DNA_ID=CAMNT_0007332373 /DNA_START=110 /DNA_END=766 /DNA_ORIENTATION=+